MKINPSRSFLPNLQASDDEISRYASLLDSLGVGLLVFSPDATLALSNDAAARLLGESLHGWGQPGKAAGSAELPLLQVFRSSRAILARETALAGDHGKEIHVSVNLLPVLAADESVRLVLVTLDASGRGNGTTLSIHDPLTTVFNERYVLYLLENEVHRARRYGTPFTLAQIDIDLFPALCAEHGPAVGETILAGVGRLMQATMREIDIVGRLGHDEFLLILPNATLKHALVGLERLRVLVETKTFGEAELRVTISGGIVEYTGENPEALVERARSLLLNARDYGRNRFCLDVDIL